MDNWDETVKGIVSKTAMGEYARAFKFKPQDFYGTFDILGKHVVMTSRRDLIDTARRLGNTAIDRKNKGQYTD